jgi:cytochrome c
VTNGGIKRVYMERVAGAWQGAAFHFSAGLQGAVNRLVRGPDGSIYVGEVGNPPNWSEIGKAWHGLERLSYRGRPAFELLKVNAEPDGFSLILTEPLHESILLEAGDLIAKQWFYHPTEQYGGPKYDHNELTVTALELSPDRRRIKAVIPDLKAGYVVYLRLSPRLESNKGQSLWVGEAWYTLNAIPRSSSRVERREITSKDDDSADGWKILLAGKTLGGWRNYDDPDGPVENWKIEDGVLALQPGRFSRLSMIAGYLFGGGTGDLIYAEERFRNFELSLEWKIAENGNSGILYLVADEDHAAPWQTGPEMQVLHNEGHPDGRIDMHRAGDLYDLVAAKPQTVREPGEWNHVLIRIRDDQIEHWLNGTKVVNIKRGGAEWEAALAASKFADMPDFGKSDEGYIVLQDHGDPVWYRNMKIRRLSE